MSQVIAIKQKHVEHLIVNTKLDVIKCDFCEGCSKGTHCRMPFVSYTAQLPLQDGRLINLCGSGGGGVWLVAFPRKWAELKRAVLSLLKEHGIEYEDIR